MSISEQDLKRFEEFALGRLQNGEVAMSLSELAQLWETEMQNTDGDRRLAQDTATMTRLAREQVERQARIQGVAPVENATDLVVDFWPNDETADAFLETIHSGRDSDTAGDRLND